MFPIHDRRGRVVAFGGRVIDQGEPKYLNSPETPVFQKRYELYGLFQLKQSTPLAKRILVVEGYMDVVFPGPTWYRQCRRYLRYGHQCATARGLI